MMNSIQRITPAAKKKWLCFLSGAIWTIVGIFLCSFTIAWLRPLNVETSLVFGLVGVVLAIAINFYGFTPFANQNILRIDSYQKEKVCIFAFQKWSSYPLVIFMIGLGIFLRKYSPIPKPWLAILYIGIGGSLFLASFRYYKRAIWGSDHD